MAQEARRLLRVTGRVQGVGYRAFVQDQAMLLGLGGWVRNRRDGSVEALVAGEGAAVVALTALLRKGPPGARVLRVDESEAPTAAWIGVGFDILPTI